MKLKKILIYIAFGVFVFLISGCTKPIYTITYYLDGKLLSFELDSYSSGEEIVLPTIDTSDMEGIIFDGWYLNSDLTGDKITSISANESGNKVYYGTIKEVSIDNPITPDLDKVNLQEVFGYVGFTLELKYSSNYYDYIEYFYVDNGKYHYTSEYYDCYYGDVNGIEHYYYNYDSNNYYYCTENDSEFETYLDIMFYVSLLEIDTDKLIEEDGYYSCLDSYCDTLGFLLTGYEEEYSNIKIYISNNQLSKITMDSISYESFEEIKYSYELNFSNFNSTTVNFPSDAIHEGSVEEQSLSISEVYNLEKGDEVTITGVITGTYGNNFYISDGHKGILIYLGNDSSFNAIVEAGVVVEVCGEVDIYKDVHQIKNPTSIVVSSKDIDLNCYELDNINQEELSIYINDMVNVNNLIIEEIPSYQSGSDYSFTCSLYGVEVTIFISRHLGTEAINELIKVLDELNVGDTLNINNIFVGKYNDYQLSVASSTTFSHSLEVGLSVEPASIKIPVNLKLQDILDELTVYFINEAGVKTKLTSDQYTLNDNGYTIGKVGTFEFTFSYLEYEASCIVEVFEDNGSIKYNLTSSPLKDVVDEQFYDQNSNSYVITKGLPSLGNPKVLVIPIEFTDCLASSDMVSDLEKAFFGSSDVTGWESVNSYYKKSSYGKLNITGTVLEPFNTGHTVDYYNNLYKKYLEDLEAYNNYETDDYPVDVEYSIIEAALKYYDSVIDYSEYDTDKDGYIDSIYLIYACDYSEEEDSLWWAFAYQYYSENPKLYDGVEADYYALMSYQFLFDEFYGTRIELNAETYIHETGHLLGLDDYYDYDSSVGPDGGIGGGDMMDYNVGDHNPYSKMILGWIDPIILTGQSQTFTLNKFESSGDALFIFKNWNETFFDEFFVIDYYSPSGLNAAQAGYNGLFSIPGVRIYHVNATLNEYEEVYSMYDITKYNNSYSDKRLISLIEADGNNDISIGGWSEDSDLFTAGAMFTNPKWQDGTSAKFTISVLTIDEENCTIKITFE